MESKYRSVFTRVSSFFAYLVIVISLLTLIGWLADIDILRRPISHLVAMNPLTASCFFLSSIALILGLKKSDPQKRFETVNVINFFIVTVCLISVVQRSMHTTFNIDHILFAEKLKEDSLVNLSNNMAITTSLCFVAMNIAMFLKKLYYRHTLLAANILSVLVALLSLFSLTGYAYRVNEFYKMLALLPMALSTAACFMLLALGTLFQRPEVEPFKRITASFVSSAVGRLMLLASVLVPFFAGLVVLWLHWYANINTELSIALLVLLLIIVFILLVWRNTNQLVEKEKTRLKAEAALFIRTEELAAANTELQNINQKLEEFAYIASHDLQEPLRKIQVFGNLSKKSIEDGEQEKSMEYLEKIESSSTKMREMIANLLDYSRILNNDEQEEKINLDALLKEVVDDFKSTTDKKGVSIVTGNFEPVAGNAVQLRQAFENLIGNAIKFARPETPLQLSILPLKTTGAYNNMQLQPTDQKNNLQFIEVKDNGIGFDQQYADKIFSMFTRLHGKQQFKGTGIGLAIVKKVIENHNGYITAFGHPGKGAAFVIALPKMLS